MGTRSCIFVYGGQATDYPFAARLYRHSDGYPSANLATIANAASVCKGSAKSLAQALLNSGEGVRLEVPSAWVLRPIGDRLDSLATNIRDFCANPPADAASRLPERSSCAWVGGWMAGLEDHIRVARPAEQDPDGLADPWMAPSKDELADLPLGFKLDVRILGSQGDLEWVYFVDVDRKNISVYGGEPNTASWLVARGGQDPMSQVAGVMPQYAEQEADAVAGAVEQVRKAGWGLNAAKLGIEADCESEARRWGELDKVASMLPPGMPMAFPAEVAQARFDGAVLMAGEFWVLQRAPAGERAAFFVHEREALQGASLSEGMAYSVNYLDLDRTKALAVPLAASARPSGPRAGPGQSR